MEPSSTRVLFFGSPEFAVPSLNALAEAGYQIAGVVTQPDKPAGRGGAVRQPAVKTRALELSIPVFQPDSLREPSVVEEFAGLSADVFVVAAYGKIIPVAMLALPSRGSINVHASLLPKWRGASPITASILAGDAESGVTIMEVVRKMDAGPAVSSRAEAVRPDDTTGTLEPRLAEVGAQLLIETLPNWYDRKLTVQPQDDEAATYCSLITRDQAHLQSAWSAADAERAVRAFNPWPSAWAGYRDTHLTIHAAHTAENRDDANVGALLIERGLPAIAFADGLLVLDEVQKPGSRRISGRDFLNGERNRLPESVGLA